MTSKASMPGMVISPRLQAKELARRDEAERKTKEENQGKQKRKRSAAVPAAAAAVRPSPKRLKAGKTNGCAERTQQSRAREKAKGRHRETAKVAIKGGSRANGLTRETPKLPIRGASSTKGLNYATLKLASRGASRATGLDRETPKAAIKGASSAKGLKRETPKLTVKEASRAKGLNRDTPKVTIKGASSAREKERQRKRTGVRRREEPRATARQRAPENSRKAAKAVLPLPKSKGKKGEAPNAAATKSKLSRPRKELFKCPTSRDRRAFKLSKSLLPLGVWPSNQREEFDLPHEWKANTLKRYEHPPPYRKLKANRYADNSLRGLVPIDEIPMCHCDVDCGCDANCINRQLLMECAPGRCPTLRGGPKHCLNNAIQTRSFPSTEIFRTFEGRGWGLRLSDEKGADAGTLLHEYLGQVIGMDECRKRLRKVGRKGVEGSSSDFYFASLDGNLVLDAGPMGSEARFANHSCAPNCILQKWSVLGETRVVLVAAKDISYAEELTYNYQADTLEGFVERQRCLCGEPQCSGFIGGELVAVKADEWRRRTLKVLGQAKPQLGLVRELFNEGRDLGFEEEGEDGGVCYRGREMECLSTMLKEGDDWLAQLAEVLEGAPDKPTTDPSPPPSLHGLRSTAAAADGCCADGARGRRGGGLCDGADGRRVRSRATSAVEVNERRRIGREVSASVVGSSTRSSRRGEVGGNGTRPEIKCETGAPNGSGKSAPAAAGGGPAATLGATASLGRGKRAAGSCASGGNNEVGEGGGRCSARQEATRPASVGGEGEENVPCAVDLMRLERVLEKAPPGLQMVEATKAKKTATRAGHVARTVWALLDAASKHGLDVLVPEQRATPLLHTVKPSATNRSARPSSHEDEGKGRASEVTGRKGAGGVTAVGAAVRAKRKGGAGAGGEERARIGCQVDGRNGARRSGEGQGDGAENGGGDMDVCAEGARIGQLGEDDGAGAGATAIGVVAAAAAAAAGVGAAGAAGAAEMASERGVDDDGADALSAEAQSETTGSEPHDESAHAEGSSVDDAGSSGTESGATARSAPCAAVTVTTRSGGKKYVSALIAEEEQQIAPLPPLVAGDGGESLALPPKPKMSQVYQAIRSCRGLAPVLIPGASELEKLVASAEAWASKACEILKIKIEVNTTSDGDAGVEDKKDTGVSKDAIEKDNKDASKEKEKSRWEKLGLESSAMSALEEKLQEVAEFSLAREQREEELEKERVLKEKEDTKEREKQAKLNKLARFKCLAKRRRPREGGGGGVSGGRGGGAEGGNAAGNDVEGGVGGGSGPAWEARRSPRCISSADTGGPDASAVGRGVAEADMSAKTGDACASVSETQVDPSTTSGGGLDGWKPEDEDALHCLCRLPADTARFRTLMTCDLCHSWFHPACVRLKEVRESQRNTSQALAFACPMCEHKRGGVSNFACPPSPGFYIGRRMHRPGLAELEPLVAHAEGLPVDGVDGQDYLSYMVKQVVDWSGRCHAAVKDVQEYIQGGSSAGPPQTHTPGVAERKAGGEAAGQVEVQNASSLAPAGGLASNSTPGDSRPKPIGEGAVGCSEKSLAEISKDAHAGPKEASDVSSPVPPAVPAVPAGVSPEHSLAERVKDAQAELKLAATEARNDAHAGLREPAKVSSPVPPAVLATPACSIASDGDALIGTDSAAVTAPAALGVAEPQSRAQPAVARGSVEGTNTAEETLSLVASAVGAAAPAVPVFGESQGFVQPVVAQGDIEGPDPVEANPANVAFQVRGTPVQASPGDVAFQVDVTPVGFGESAENQGDADTSVGGGRTGDRESGVDGEDAGTGVRGGGGGGGGAGEALMHEVEASQLKSSVGLVLPSVGRDLVFETGLMERLGRLVCEGALIEVVDVHKEDVMIRRALWMLSASLAYPSAAASLRAGQQPGLEETLSVRDQEVLRSSGLSSDYPTRLRPTFETLEASLTEGRTLGLSRNKGKDKYKSRRGSGSHSGAGFTEPPLPPSGGLGAQGLVDMRPSSEPLGAGARVYGCLFDAVGDIIQAVVKAEAKPFREARMFLPVLKTATRWAAIEPSWGFARALASELFWLRESGKRACAGEAALAEADTLEAAAAAATAPAAAEALAVLAATAAAAVAAPTPAAAAAAAVAAAPRFGAAVLVEPTMSVEYPPRAATGTTCAPAATATIAAASAASEGQTAATTSTAAAAAAVYPIGHAAGTQREACVVDPAGKATGGGAAGNIWEPEEGAYCICRGGDDGGVMVSCDACKEWFHAPCVGLTARVADGLEEYYCLVCCGSQPEKYGHYAHSWVTNVAVEAAVRRLAPKKSHPVSATKKRKNKATTAAKTSGESETSPLHVGKGSSLHAGKAPRQPLNSGPAGENIRAESMATGVGAGGVSMTPGRGTHKRQRVASARLAEAVADAAEMVSATNVVPTKRLRDKKGRGSDPPGAKRARATAWVASYVERHYAELGIRWPPERPTSREEVREDLDEPLLNDGEALRGDKSDDAGGAGAGAGAAAVVYAAAADAAAAMVGVPPNVSGSQEVPADTSDASRNAGGESVIAASQQGYAIPVRQPYFAGTIGANQGGYTIPVRSPSLAELLAAGQAADTEDAGDQSGLQTGVFGGGFSEHPGTAFGARGEGGVGQASMPFQAGGQGGGGSSASSFAGVFKNC